MREEIEENEFEKSAFQETLSSIGLRQIYMESVKSRLVTENKPVS